ncbi:molybdenum cofactor guanylyltransferase [Chloroflexota bacterium]
MDISCIVLAGGKGLRLGRNKALETVNSSSLLQRVVSQLSFLNSDIIIVAAAKQSFPGLTGYSKLRIVVDAYPGKGPLVGICTGLAASDSFYNLVVACDMPFLSQALLQYMIQVTDNFDLVVPRLGRMVEPLHAIYSKNCSAPAEGLLSQGNRSVHQLLTMVRVRYVETEEIDRIDPQHLSFFNINTEVDLETARKLAERHKP